MRVVHIIKATGLAGAERHLLALLPGLRARGLDVRLLLLHAPTAPAADVAGALAAAGVPVERLLIRRHVDPGVVGRIGGALRALRPDIAHTHLIHADLYGTLAARLAGVPTIITTRHNDDPFRRLPALRLLHAGLWRLTTRGIAISESVRGFCERVEGAPPGKMTTIHYGIPPTAMLDRAAAAGALRAELRLPRHVPLIGFVGRLIAQKGVEYGLQAFARALLTHPTAQLVIVGDGKDRAKLERRARAYGIAGSVHFLGWRADAAALMAAFDLLIMPSLWEGFGLVLLEAMAARTPVIASAVSAIPEIVVHGETGVLVPPRDVAALGDALVALLDDAPLRQHMGLLGEDRLEAHFSAAAMIDKTAALYTTVKA